MKKYIELMEHIYPTPEQKNKMLENAYQANTAKQHKFRLRYCIPALVLCIAFSSTVFAEEIKNTFYGLLGKNELVEKEVLNDVYTDTDGHVTMSVKEVLSDKINSYVIIEYTACDDKGRKWLDNYLNVHTLNLPALSPENYDTNISGYFYGDFFLQNYEEQLELRTDNSRVFKVLYTDTYEELATDFFDLTYPLADKWENHALINIEDSVKYTDISLDSTKAPKKYYKPMGVKISPLGIMIYGKDMGMVEKGTLPGGSTYSKLVHYDEIDSLYLVMKDGTKQNLIGENISTGPNFLSNTDEKNYDCSIYCSYFKDYMDMAAIDGIELDGVYYSLSKYLK